MLLANKNVAEWINKVFAKKTNTIPPFVYRIHDEPSQERLHTFSEFLEKLGYKLDVSGRKRLSNSLNLLLNTISGKAEENMIETIAVRTMAKAIYSPDNIGHYGLGFQYYTHFTSPIRRYPDLMVHRLLNDYLNNKLQSETYNQLVESCKHCSNMEKKAADAERESVKYKQAEFMAERIGETFGGVISGVSKWGIFVEIDEIKAEGLVRMNNIGNDFFYLDDENYCVIGHKTGKTLRLGDRVSVLIKAVDLGKKQLELGLVSHVSQNGKEDKTSIINVVTKTNNNHKSNKPNQKSKKFKKRKR
jgi:ribonuclease R